MELMPYDEMGFTYVLDLFKGTYFVGYFNKDDNSIFNLRFTRIVSEFPTTKLVSDPDNLSLFGSVRLMGEDEIIIERRYSLNRKVVIRITLTVI